MGSSVFSENIVTCLGLKKASHIELLTPLYLFIIYITERLFYRFSRKVDLCDGGATIAATSLSALPTHRFTKKCSLLPKGRSKAFTGSRTSKMVS